MADDLSDHVRAVGTDQVRCATGGTTDRHDRCEKCSWPMLYHVKFDDAGKSTPISMFCDTSTCKQWLVEIEL